MASAAARSSRFVGRLLFVVRASKFSAGGNNYYVGSVVGGTIVDGGSWAVV